VFRDWRKNLRRAALLRTRHGRALGLPPTSSEQDRTGDGEGNRKLQVNVQVKVTWVQVGVELRPVQERHREPEAAGERSDGDMGTGRL